ncbi:MMPL family transporter [Beijerinckia sp. L45]|uniref:hopanoid transporter HpnN n=1 Tax=Beijerinckia sp. L45 TaxID=1641855 RepID=UPI00131C5F1C|nr:MMPL family transporter [Beijerinckia sp. L45]
MTTSHEPADLHASAMPASHGPITRFVVAIVMASARYRWLVLAVALALTVVSGWYVVGRFMDPNDSAINTNTDDFIDASVPWRQDEIAYDKAFPNQADSLIVVIDGKTPEAASAAASALNDKLQNHPDIFKSVVQPDGGPFFAKNGLLFLPTPDLRKTVGELQQARPVLGIMSSDPSLRGLMDGFEYISRGVRANKGTLDSYDRPIASMNQALENILADKPAFFSLQNLFGNDEKPSSRQTRKFIQISPVLDYSAVEPGAVPTDFVRKAAADLHLDPDHGVTVRMTGQVPIADAEFSTVLDGFGFNGLLMIVAVVAIVYAALKSFKIVGAVFAAVLVGLVVTFAAGLLLVHQLNVLSIAFAVLFIGIGVDFGIQFSVRYKAERFDHPDFTDALHMAASKVGRPLALAALATMAGFYAFLPTDYRGVRDLGEIAGTGMLIAFFCAITILPALLAVIRPPAEREAVGYKFLGPVDDFIERHRFIIIFGTLAVAAMGAPLLTHLSFDFNPLNLDNQKTEAISTLIDLMKDPETDTQTISVLEPNLQAADATADKLRQLPDVARVTTLTSLVPDDQDAKLALIAGAAKTLLPVMDPNNHIAAPSDADDIADLRKVGAAFESTAGTTASKGADDSRHFAQLAQKLADAAPAVRDRARAVLLPPVNQTLSGLRGSLAAEKITVASIPPALKDLYIAKDGQARVEAAPKGDANDNATMIRFADSIKSVAPHASGQPVSIQGAGQTVKRAFLEAGAIAIGLIFIILLIVLRRVGDVLLTLVPLLLAGVLTLEITVLIGMPLNFANIIALPLLLGLGVAFKIYFVMAWRAGTKKLLQSSLTRAVFWSALTTATAFGSLWASNHPGTSSMGKLMALSLVCTLAAAILFQPALMGPPRKTEVR